MTVYDAFADAGTAETASADQHATVKIILKDNQQEHILREGSVVPNLLEPRFQPQNSLCDSVPGGPGQHVRKRMAGHAFSSPEVLSGDQFDMRTASGKRPRLNHVQKDGQIMPNVVRSVEREAKIISRPDGIASASPFVVPETQSSAARCGVDSPRASSIVLGSPSTKCESPEITASLHSIPCAGKNGVGLGTAESAIHQEPTAVIQDENRDRASKQRGTRHALRTISTNSSAYYSPRSMRKSQTSEALSATNSTNSRPAPSLETAESAPVSEANISTPHSGSPQQAEPPVLESTTDPGTSETVAPRSRSLGRSTKFRRHDQHRTPLGNIDDTQMSPRSRSGERNEKPPNHAKGMPKLQSTRELSGLLDSTGEQQHLIQNGKRQRKEMIWDFSGQVGGDSDVDDPSFSPTGISLSYKRLRRPKMATESAPKDSKLTDDVISRYYSPSGSTNKNSDMSQDGIVTTAADKKTDYVSSDVDTQTSLNNFTSDESDVVDKATGSDKENTPHTEALQSFAVVEPAQDASLSANLATDNDPKKGRVDFEKHSSDKPTETDESVVEILNSATQKPNKISGVSNVLGPKQFGVDSKRRQTPFRNLPGSTTRKREKPRKGQGVGKLLPKNSTGPMVKGPTDESVETVAPNTEPGQVKAQHKKSIQNEETSPRPTSRAEPDEQLSMDLQASAYTDRHMDEALPHSATSSVQGQDGTGLDNDRNEVPRPRSKSQSPPARSEINLESPVAQSQASLSARTTHPPTVQDGKLGLGFSQSPPGKQRASRLHLYSKDADSSRDGESSDAMAAFNSGSSSTFLKKPPFVERLMSSQSFTVDTPSRHPPSRQKDSPVMVEATGHPSPDASEQQVSGVDGSNQIAATGKPTPKSSLANNSNDSSHNTDPDGHTHETLTETPLSTEREKKKTKKTKTKTKGNEENMPVKAMRMPQNSSETRHSSRVDSHLNSMSPKPAPNSSDKKTPPMAKRSGEQGDGETKTPSTIMPPGYTPVMYQATRESLDKNGLQAAANAPSGSKRARTSVPSRPKPKDGPAAAMASTKSKKSHSKNVERRAQKTTTKEVDADHDVQAREQDAHEKAKEATKASKGEDVTVMRAQLDQDMNQAKPVIPSTRSQAKNCSSSQSKNSSTVRQESQRPKEIASDNATPRPPLATNQPSELQLLTQKRTAERATKKAPVPSSFSSHPVDRAGTVPKSNGTQEKVSNTIRFEYDDDDSGSESETDSDGDSDSNCGVSSFSASKMMKGAHNTDDVTSRNFSPSEPSTPATSDEDGSDSSD